MIYLFEDCVLDIERRELRCGGASCPIEPQVFELLHFLIQNRERVVSRDQVFQAVWHGRVVSDSVLSTRINAARKAIGDDGTQQRLIRTLRHNGFRFVGTVCEDKVAAEPGMSAFPAKHRFSQGLDNPIIVRHAKPSLVVLPFINMPADNELACISKGITEDVVTALARSKSFDVIAHDRVCRDGDNLRGIASELGAGYLLVCGDRKANDQVRLTVRLIDVCTGLHIWAQSYTHELYAAFAGQDAITAKMAASIEPCIYAAEKNRLRRKPFYALDAADCVTMALSITRNRSRQNYAVAERLLTRAIEIDPDCVRAHSIAAWYAGLHVLWGWKPRRNVLPLALDAAHKSVLLDDHDPWAHFALGWVLTQNRSPEEGIEEYQRAIELNPCFPHAHYCLASALGYIGRTEKALTALENGERLGAPEIFIGHGNSARAAIYFCAEKHGDAIKAARRSVQQSPGLVVSQRQLFVNYALAGEMKEARTALRVLLDLAPSASLNLIASALPFVRDNDLNRTLNAFHLMGVR